VQLINFGAGRQFTVSKSKRASAETVSRHFAKTDNEKIIVISTTLILSNFLFSCDETKSEQDIGTHLQTVLEEKARQREIDSFVVPDSINTSLIVATFYEIHPKGHSLIVNNDTGKTTATKIKYLPDSTVLTDPLQTTKFNEFTSTINKSVYIVRENTVSYLYSNNGIGATFDYNRTDKNSY